MSGDNSGDNAPIEIDNLENDRDSVLDERLSAYTASLTSSVVDYPVEHGRTYHAFRAGSYALPNDEKERDRLDLNHHLVFKALGDRIYLAPLEPEKIHRILDIGTGTGIWAIEMGDEFPGAEVLGNDLSPIQPEWVPPNVKFEVDDVESEWTYTHPFDFIFSRYMFGVSDWPKLIGNMYNNLRPGGFVELQDYDLMVYSEDGSMSKDSATYKWASNLLPLTEKIGRVSSPGPKLEGWVRDAGFKNIVARRFKLPVGPWAKDPVLKEVGIMNLIQMLNGLEAFSFRLLCDVGGWSETEVHVMLAQVRKEMKDPAFHIQMDLYVVYAQKE